MNKLAKQQFNLQKDVLNTNLNNFSEWSSICLIRGISQPQLTVQGFSENETKVIN